MINRRTVLGAAFAGLALVGGLQAAVAADWKTQYPELTLAVIPAENASTTVDRYTPRSPLTLPRNSAFRSSCRSPMTTPP